MCFTLFLRARALSAFFFQTSSSCPRPLPTTFYRRGVPVAVVTWLSLLTPSLPEYDRGKGGIDIPWEGCRQSVFSPDPVSAGCHTEGGPLSCVGLTEVGVSFDALRCFTSGTEHHAFSNRGATKHRKLFA